MSHTSKTLKSIAAGEEYKSLVSAIEKRDYQSLYESYMKVAKLLEEAGKGIEEKIENLPRRNKDEDRQKFQTAFALRSRTALPQWYGIKSEIQKQKIMDGVVVSIGKKGDPLARTPEGKLVVLSGSSAKEGDRVTLKVITEGEKLGFGRQFELTPESFYFMLNQEVYQQVRDSLDFVHKSVESYTGAGDESLTMFGEILRVLEEVRELVPKIQESDRENVTNRILFYRRRLMSATVEKLVLDLIATEEEKGIKELCAGDEAQITCALNAPGLFRPRSFQAFREGLFTGDKLRGYTEVMGNLEKGLDTMDSALQFMEFKAGMEGLQPRAKLYVDKMERFLRRLQEKARQFSITLADDRTGNVEEIRAKIQEAFSEKVLGNELSRVFRTAGEFFDTRGAALELKAKLGDTQCLAAETELKPYLRHKVNRAFGEK